MPKNDLTFVIGGEAGQGLESSSAGFTQAIARAGLHLFHLLDYRSRIRGGYNYAQIRVHSDPILSHNEDLHLLLALTPEALPRHLEKMTAGSAIIFDEHLSIENQIIAGARSAGVQLFSAPLRHYATEIGGSAVMTNTAAVAAACGVMGFPLSFIEEIIRENFRKKGNKVIDANLKVAAAAFAFADKEYAGSIDHKLVPMDAPPRMVINGNQAFGFGALAGGCRFVAGYPMTPGSPVLEWMAGYAKRFNLVVKHTEDEIAAICMAIGAGHVGARALVPTSGGGFSLMVEALGFAGMAEIPVVIYEAQRPGPSTGLPTRHEQGDLLFTLFASQGEFPRIVLTPGTIEESFAAGYRAFNLAETYQTPVIVLSDHFVATSARTIDADALDPKSASIERGKLLSGAVLDHLEDKYLRYAVTEDGISPRALPGHPKGIYVAEGNDHEAGSGINEEIGPRNAQMDKRMRKLDTATKDIGPAQTFGPPEAPLSLIGWGSTIGPALEALKQLNASQATARYIHIADIWPFPAGSVKDLLSQSQLTVAIEGNATGQLARLLRQETGITVEHVVHKYDGRPFSPEYIVRGVNDVVKEIQYA